MVGPPFRRLDPTTRDFHIESLFADEHVRVGIQRHALACVPELRRQVGDRNALAQLQARVAVAQIVRRVAGGIGPDRRKRVAFDLPSGPK